MLYQRINFCSYYGPQVMHRLNIVEPRVWTRAPRHSPPPPTCPPPPEWYYPDRSCLNHKPHLVTEFAMRTKKVKYYTIFIKFREHLCILKLHEY